MKKIITSKITLFTSLTIAVLFLAFYIFMLVRPISYGMMYSFKGELTFPYEGSTMTVDWESEMTFHSNNKATIRNTNNDTYEDYYYYKDGYLVFCMVDNEDAYKAKVAEIEANWENIKNDELAYKINAFAITSQTVDLDLVQKCNGTIILAVLGGIFELLVIGLTVTSFVVGNKTKAIVTQEQ